MYPLWTRIHSIPLSSLNRFKIRLMQVFVQKYLQKLYILKIEAFLVINTHDFVGQEKGAKIFQILQLKRLHAFSNWLEIGITVI